MEEIRFSTVQEFNDHYGVPTLHPLVTVVRFDREVKLEEHMCHYGLYALFLKENKGCQLSYGKMLRYRHSDMAELEKCLQKVPETAQPHSARQEYRALRVLRLHQQRSPASLVW